MTKKQAAAHFPSVRQFCKALGIAESTYYRWGKYPPKNWQAMIRELVNGKEVLQK